LYPHDNKNKAAEKSKNKRVSQLHISLANARQVCYKYLLSDTDMRNGKICGPNSVLKTESSKEDYTEN